MIILIALQWGSAITFLLVGFYFAFRAVVNGLVTLAVRHGLGTVVVGVAFVGFCVIAGLVESVFER